MTKKIQCDECGKLSHWANWMCSNDNCKANIQNCNLVSD